MPRRHGADDVFSRFTKLARKVAARSRGGLFHEGLESRQMMAVLAGTSQNTTVLPLQVANSAAAPVPVATATKTSALTATAPAATTGQSSLVMAQVGPMSPIQTQQAPVVVNQQNATLNRCDRIGAFANIRSVAKVGAAPLPAPQVTELNAENAVKAAIAAFKPELKDVWGATLGSLTPNAVNDVVKVLQTVVGAGTNLILNRVDVTEFYRCQVTPNGGAQKTIYLQVSYSISLASPNAANTGLMLNDPNFNMLFAAACRPQVGAVSVLFDGVLNNEATAARVFASGKDLPSVQQWLWDNKSLKVQAARPVR